MAILSITYPNFIPFTTILASQVNQNFADITAWANTPGSITGGPGGNIAAGSITGTEIQDGTLTGGLSGDLALETITTDNVLNGTLKLEDMATEVTDAITDAADSGRLLARIPYTVSGSFSKATYPTAESITVHCIGGGGGGGGVSLRLSGKQEALGAFGGGGGYAMRDIDVSTIADPEAIVVGAGGSPGLGSVPNAGGSGGTSTFAAGKAWQVQAGGGGGGTAMSPGFGYTSVGGGPGAPKAGCIGLITSGGNAGENATRVDDDANNPGTSGFVIPQGTSGDGFFGGAVRSPGGAGGTGLTGDGPGAGGSGGRVLKGPGGANGPYNGGGGAAGLVIIEVYG